MPVPSNRSPICTVIVPLAPSWYVALRASVVSVGSPVNSPYAASGSYTSLGQPQVSKSARRIHSAGVPIPTAHPVRAGTPPGRGRPGSRVMGARPV